MEKESILLDMFTQVKNLKKSVFHPFSILAIILLIAINRRILVIPNEWVWIFIILVALTFIMSFMDICQRIFKAIENKISKKRDQKILKEVLNSLDSAEKEILFQFYYKDRNTLGLSSTLPVVVGLVDKNVLIRTSKSFSYGGEDPHKINDYLKSIINPEEHLNFTFYKEIKEQNNFYSS